MSAAKWSRKWHRIGALVSALPVLVILVTGVMLQLKKELSWIQPPTQRGADPHLELTWDGILEAVAAVPEADVDGWEDIDRLDVRPGRGLLKVRCANRWEVQLDAVSGDVLSSHYRRSDLIESLHDGSWFHSSAKYWLFLPAALVLCGLWASGVYLWLLPHLIKRRRRS